MEVILIILRMLPVEQLTLVLEEVEVVIGKLPITFGQAEQDPLE